MIACHNQHILYSHIAICKERFPPIQTKILKDINYMNSVTIGTDAIYALQ